MKLLRDTIKHDIVYINGMINNYENMIAFYERQKEKLGEWEYLDERIHKLYGEMAEYLVAREDAKDQIRYSANIESG